MTDDQPANAVPAVSPSLREYRASEVATFGDFYKQFTPKLIRFLMWKGARLEDAADIAQDTMVKLWNEWSDVRSPKTWAKTVAGRELVRRVSSITEHPIDQPDERSALLPDDLDIAALERRHDILRALATLPIRQRQVMAWTLDGHTPTEIAEILRITPEAVRSSLRKARRSIAIHVSEER